MSTINIDRAMIERALEAMMNLPVLGWLPEQEKISFEVITILRTALGQPEQEPVAWMEEMEPEPNVLRSVRMTSVREVAQEWKKPIPLYTAPPQRKPLTDMDIADIYKKWDATPGVSMADFARAIETAHNIKE